MLFTWCYAAFYTVIYSSFNSLGTQEKDRMSLMVIYFVTYDLLGEKKCLSSEFNS